MAGYPPYPPPPGSPYGPPPGFNAREQARFARQQIKSQVRAQKMAFRAQRDLYRQQARAMRRTSILGPLLIVAIGVILLLIRLGSVPFSEFAFFYAHWWPLLFVAAGLILASEWAFDHYSHHEGVPFVRRRLGGGVVLLLILLAITGASIGTLRMHPFFMGWHVDPDDLGEFFGERHEYEQDIDQPFPAGTTLNVDNPHGDVTIVGKSGDDKIHIVVNKQVYSWNGGDASRRADQLSPRVALNGGTLTVSIPALDAAQSDLAITIPDTAQITVNANHGAINVSDLNAPVNLTSNHGDIEIDRIVGPVTIHVNNNSSSFSAHGIQGDVTLRGHADDVNLTDVTGAVSLEGEFWGDAHLEHLGSTVAFRTSRTQLSVGKLDGMIDVSPDEELTGSQIVGPTECHTRSRNIAFERITGSVDIINSNGTVDLTNANPLGNVSVQNKDGVVTLTLPEEAGATVFAQTQDGSINSDLDLPRVPSNNVTVMNGTIGDGSAHITIHTTHADINIHKGVVEPPTPPAPPAAPPAQPAVPEKPAPKHHPATPRKPEASTPSTASI